MNIKLIKSTTRERIEVLGIQKCQNEKYLAIVSGKKLIRNESMFSQLLIYQRYKKMECESEESSHSLSNESLDMLEVDTWVLK